MRREPCDQFSAHCRTLDEIADGLLELQELDWITIRDKLGRPTRVTAAQIAQFAQEHERFGCGVVPAYELTPQGGASWEQLAKPDWSGIRLVLDGTGTRSKMTFSVTMSAWQDLVRRQCDGLNGHSIMTVTDSTPMASRRQSCRHGVQCHGNPFLVELI